MKKILCISALLFMVLLFSIFAGCNKDSPTKPEEATDLVGTWDLIKMSSEYQGEKETITESQIDSIGLVWTLKIRADGSVEQITNMSGPLLTFPGSWKSSSDHFELTLTAPTGEIGTLEFKFTVNKNILQLYWKLPAGADLYAEFRK